jgi:hypothetical protein
MMAPLKVTEHSQGTFNAFFTGIAPHKIATQDHYDREDMPTFKLRLIKWLGQMMFVSGETAEPSPETTWMIEEIVREQVVEMVSHPTHSTLASH